MADNSLFGFAGFWETWKGPDGPVESATIITTEPNELTVKVHDRMPVILHADDYSACLTDDDPDKLAGFSFRIPPN